MDKDATQRHERTADRLIVHATSKHGRRQRVRQIIKPCLEQEKHHINRRFQLPRHKLGHHDIKSRRTGQRNTKSSDGSSNSKLDGTNP
jgi:hypothetical protein